MQPGDLVKYDHPANSTLGLVRSMNSNRTHAVVLVQWCNGHNTEEYVWQENLKVVSDQ